VLRLPPINFRAPQRLEEVLATLSSEDVRLVAGGTDLWPNMKRRHQTAETVVSLLSVPGLRGIEHTCEEAEGGLKVGRRPRLSRMSFMTT